MAQAPATPSPNDLALESAMVLSIVADKPMEYNGRKRSAGQAVEDFWTNVAYWKLYGDTCPVQLPKTGAEPCRGAWIRLRGLVGLAVAQKPPPAPAPGSWVWPIALTPMHWKGGGKFGARRPWKPTKPQTRYHVGVDLGAALGTPVRAPEAGVVLAGDHGWEAPVRAVVMHSDSGRTILLGGVKAGSGPPKGTRVAAGQIVGEVGAYPLGDTMCHVTVWSRPLTLSEVYARQSWALGTPKPEALIDPADLLKSAMGPNVPMAVGLDENGETDEGVLRLDVQQLLTTFLGVA